MEKPNNLEKQLEVITHKIKTLRYLALDTKDTLVQYEQLRKQYKEIFGVDYEETRTRQGTN